MSNTRPVPKFQLQQYVSIEVPSVGKMPGARGTGYITGMWCEADTWIYQISVETGQFDIYRDHRKELWVNECEMELLEEGS